MDIFDRIEKIRKDSGSSMQTFADALGVTIGVISNIAYKRTKSKPNAILIKSICMTYHVNQRWLETGEGEPYSPPQEIDLAQEVRDLMQGKNPLEVAVMASLAAMPDEWWQLWADKLHEEMKRQKRP